MAWLKEDRVFESEKELKKKEFRLHEEVGKGSYGVVYLAKLRQGKERGRDVAIKKISDIGTKHQRRNATEVYFLKSSRYGLFCVVFALSCLHSNHRARSIHAILSFYPFDSFSSPLCQPSQHPPRV